MSNYTVSRDMAEESDSNVEVDTSSCDNTGHQVIESRLFENSVPLPFDSGASTNERIAALETAFTRCIILSNGVNENSSPHRGSTDWRDRSANSAHSSTISSRVSSPRPRLRQYRDAQNDHRETSRDNPPRQYIPHTRQEPPLPLNTVNYVNYMSYVNQVLPDIAYLKMADFKAPNPPREMYAQTSGPYNQHLPARFMNRSLHVIEVLQGDVSHIAEGRYGTRRKASSKPSREPIPERVRIRSRNLLRALEELGKGKISLPHPGVIPLRAIKEQGMETKEAPYLDMVFLRPFKLFVELESEIRDYAVALKEKVENSLSNSDADVEQDRVTLTHIDLLIELFDTGLKGLFELRQQIANGTLETIAFADLWHLYSMNEELCSKYLSKQIYRILHITGGRQLLDTSAPSPPPPSPPPLIVRRRRRSPPSRYRSRSWDTESDEDGFPTRVRTLPGLDRFQRFSTFDIQCFSLDFDGQFFGPVDKVFNIQPYEGVVAVHTLEVYPIKFVLGIEGGIDLYRSSLIDRGRRFLEYSKIVHMHYHGLSLDMRKEENDSQVMIDFASAMQRNPQWRPDFEMSRLLSSFKETREVSTWRSVKRVPPCIDPGCCGNDYIHGDNEIDLINANKEVSELEDILLCFRDPTILDESDLILFPPRLFGFIFRDRRWIRLHIDDLRPVEPLEAGLNSLYLPLGHRESLLALVRNHSKVPESEERPDMQFDLISGKGRGLIVLLHGPPGVGKTSTAEAIASHTQRPLFPITCGDIGESAEDVERHLKSIFQLANKWGCVLLLDEADVFLQRRNKTDLKRNSLVSVFLRILEYYSGILFLTSNRIGAIDPAFKSRIHMSLYYPSLSLQATREIWKWHINNVSKKRKDVEMSKTDKMGIFQFAQTHYDELTADGSVWNGRQIRNAFQTAVALADYDAFTSREKYKVPIKPHLTKEHFEKVAKTSKEFDTYLQSTWGGHNEDDMARRSQERSDQRVGMKPPSRISKGGIRDTPSLNMRSGKDHEDFREDDDDEFGDSDDGARKNGDDDSDEEDWTNGNVTAIGSSQTSQQTLLQPNPIATGARGARGIQR